MYKMRGEADGRNKMQSNRSSFCPDVHHHSDSQKVKDEDLSNVIGNPEKELERLRRILRRARKQYMDGRQPH